MELVRLHEHYRVLTKVSWSASARAPRRPAGCRDLTHHGRTATTRLRAAVKSASARSRSSTCAAALVRAPPPLGAGQRVHDLEVVERPALVAGATSRAQAVNFMAYSDGCILLGVPVQHRCSGAAHRT